MPTRPNNIYALVVYVETAPGGGGGNLAPKSHIPTDKSLNVTLKTATQKIKEKIAAKDT